jgi:hypothetical protein
MNNILFTDFATEIKPLLSGIEMVYQIESLNSDLVNSIEDITDCIGEDIYNLALLHYQSDDFNQDPETNPAFIRLNKLVWYIQNAQANFAFFRHWPWYVQIKLKNEEPIPQSLSVELKENLIQTAWKNMDRLVNFLDSEATQFTIWEAEKDYLSGAIVTIDENTFYSAKADFTSGETFEPTAWNVKPNAELVFPEWSTSSNFKTRKDLVFANYKDFDKIHNINKSAAFYIKIAQIIARITEYNIASRFGNWPLVLDQVRHDSLTDVNKEKIRLIKPYLAFMSIGTAINELQPQEFPTSLRVHSGSKLSLDSDGFEKFAAQKFNEANIFLSNFEAYTDFLERSDPELEESFDTDIETDFYTADDNFVLGI